MSQSVTDFDIIRSNQSEYVTAFIRDPQTNELTDVVGTSIFSLINISDDSTEVSQSFTASGGGVIEHPATGTYQYLLNTSTYADEYLAAYRCLLSGETVNMNVYVKSVSSRHFAYAAALRAQVDKARKSVSDDIENMDRTNFEPSIRFFYGYDDKHLIFYLERGLQYINAVPPYTSLTIDQYPFDSYGSVLIDAATIAALEAQGIFSIDTDFSYSLGGNSLVIDHYSKISSALSDLVSRFNSSLIAFKQVYRSRGTVLYQFLPGGVRAARQLSAMPSGWWSRVLSTGY